MQIVSTKVETSGNLGNTEDVLMGIDKAATSLILGNLIRQYQNPYKAAMQEYLSNALDSHRLVGQTAAIELSLPSSLSPQLVIEDFGRGLSRDELKLFGQFGASSKRDSNDQIGGFGIGSKAGLAISSQFTVSAVKDGKRNTVIIKRREDGHPMMSFLDEQNTDDSNGVRVTIPITEAHKFQKAIDEFFFLGWEEGSVLVNGVAPSTHINVHNPEHFAPLGDLGWQAKETSRRVFSGRYDSIALVDSIKYRLDLSQIEGIDRRLFQGFLEEIVIKLENGAVEIHPSREALIYDKRTREYIKDRVNALVLLGKKAYQDEIDQAPSIREALIVRRKAISLGFGDEYTYRGDKIEITSLVRPEPSQPFFGDIQLSESKITEGSRVSPYTSKRSKTNYETLLGWSFNNLSDPRRRQVLVVGAHKPKPEKRGVPTYHPETTGAIHWAISISALETIDPDPTAGVVGTYVDPSSFTLYFTTEADLSKFDKWFLGSFERIITAGEYMDVVSESRRMAAKTARDNAKNKVVVPSDTEVRVMSWGHYGGSVYRTIKIGDLDTTKTHVLLKNGASDFVDDAKAAMMTKTGYNGFRSLYALLEYARQHVVFVLANKNQNTADYPVSIPNFTDDLKGTLETLAEAAIDQKNEIQKRATIDRTGVKYDWAELMPDKFLANLHNKQTAEWIKAMGESNTEGDKYLQNVVRHGARFSIDIEKAKIISKISVSPGKSYPLLKSIGAYNADWKSIVEYVNLIDSVKSAESTSWVIEP